MARRILYLIDGLAMGGAERGLVLTLRHLDRSRYEPEVAYLWGPAPLRADLEELGVPVHHVGAGRGPRALLAIPKVRRLLRVGAFDAIHTAVVWASIVGRIAGHRAGVKVISHIANVDPLGRMERELTEPTARKARLVARLDEWTGRRYVDRFVAITQAVKAHPIRGASWDRSRIDVVLRGQDLPALRAEGAADPDPPIEDLGQPSIVCVARLSPQKGHRYLIDAMEPVLARFPAARLLMAGDGALRDELGRRAAPLGDRVAFLGVRRDARALVARADVFVFPSLWEGQGNALLEAMALGAPIVATRIPAVEETLTDGRDGLLVPPADAEALGGALVELLQDRDRAQRLGAAAAGAAERYDIREATRALEAVYARVLGAS
ncbi:MAG: glycosyltransferase [Actinobacteria bacterium]|nr:glycosyltransferase [Actinomycetota bacterium]